MTPPSSPRRAAQRLGLVASVTGPVDHVSDGRRTIAVENGDPMLATITGTGCISSALTGCFLAVNADRPLEAAAEALVALGVAGEEAARTPKAPARSTSACTTRWRRSIPATLDGKARTR